MQVTLLVYYYIIKGFNLICNSRSLEWLYRAYTTLTESRTYNRITSSTQAPLQTSPRYVPLGSFSPQENKLFPAPTIFSIFGAGYSSTTLLSGHTLHCRGCCSNEQRLQSKCCNISQGQGTTSASPIPYQLFQSPLPVPQGILSPIHPCAGGGGLPFLLGGII